jgi:Rod binding domain-containing protein
MSHSSSPSLPTMPLDWTRPAPTAALSRGAKAAREFESQLIGSLLDSLEKTFATVPGETDVPGQDEYSYMGRQALASAVSAAGGFGIAKMITEHLAERTDASAKLPPTRK